MALGFGTFLGSLAAVKHNKVSDRIIMVFSTASVAFPSFIIASVLLYVFCTALNWLPANGITTDGDYRGYILPIITLSLYPTAYITRLTRSSTLDVLNSDYIRTAKAKGVSKSKILFKHAFSGVMKFASDGKEGTTLVPDVAADSFDYTKDYVTNSDGTVTYTIPLKKNLKWSDGTSYDARAFVFAWNRAAGGKLASDYGYMFDVVKGYDKVSADVTGTEKLAIEAVADTDGTYNTLKVTLNNYVPYFGELLAFPAYYPVKDTVDDTGVWATSIDTYVGNGPMKLTRWDHNSAMVYEPNTNYHETTPR